MYWIIKNINCDGCNSNLMKNGVDGEYLVDMEMNELNRN